MTSGGYGVENIGRTVIIIGIFLIIIGIILNYSGKIPFNLGRLPGDIIYKKDNFTFYFPITTSILLSIVLSAIFYFIRR